MIINKNKNINLVILSSIFMFMVILTTVIYLMVYHRLGRREVTDEEMKRDMISRIQGAVEVNQKDKESMINSIKSY